MAFPDYRAQGAEVVRGVVPLETIELARDAVEQALELPHPTAVDYVPADRPGRFLNDSFMAWQNPAFRTVARCPAVLELAAAVLEADRIGLFFDQLLVKEPRTSHNMPWHQDLPYWPVDRPRLVTVWVPLDPVNRQSGAVLYAKGSHRWGRASRRWRLPRRDGSTPQLVEDTEVMEPTSFVHWEVEPGDVIVHHPLTVHGSPGNHSVDRRRRALALRYYADDVRYAHKPGHLLETESIATLLPPLRFADGDPIESEVFPILWERSSG